MPLKTILRSAGLAALSVAGGLLLAEGGLRLYGNWYRAARASAAPAGGVKLLCVGDSFTYGLGARPGEDYPAQLQRRLDAAYGPGAYSVINAGVPGQNSSELADSLGPLLEEHAPGFVLVLTGANNYAVRNSHFFLFAPGEVSFLRLTALRADALFSRLKVYRFFRLGGRALAARLAALTYRPRPCAPASAAALTHAAKAFDRHEFKKAAAVLEQALAVDGACAELHFQTGKMLFYFRDLPAAFVRFRSGRDLDPGHPFVRTFLAQEIPLLRPETAARAMDKLLAYDLRVIHETAARSGARTVIQTYPFATDGQRDWIRRDAAAEFSLPFVDHHAAFLPLLKSGKAGLYLSGDEPDLLVSHPNGTGYALMADNLLDALEKLRVLESAAPAGPREAS
ncbi:MAG: GDSL-type esterase/lipase family protein [Elusimicrobiales bacterium]|nr:GDSL-type esterase/lipase family protein [Elusimicrobiales bacterium]